MAWIELHSLGRLRHTRRPSIMRVWLLLSLIALTGLAACAGADAPGATPDSSRLAAFKQMAADAQCADQRNRLFLIDGEWIFWDIAGSCSDAAYSQILFGATPDEVLCRNHDSIAGPVKECLDPTHEELFDALIENLDEPDLGNLPGHTIQQIPF